MTSFFQRSNGERILKFLWPARLEALWRLLASRKGSLGSVSITFAFSVIPIISILGAAADYSTAQVGRSQLNAAADVAALTTVGVPARSITAGAAKERARQAFATSTLTTSALSITSVEIDVKDAGAERSVTVSYAATFKPSFLKLFGFSSLAITGVSKATGPLMPYIDFYLLLDNTPSMGVGATSDDINKMVANTADKCAFACHQMDRPTSDYYSLAKKLGVKMRIDVVRSATQELMDTAVSSQIRADQFRAAIYTFGQKAENAVLTEVAGLSSNLSAAKSASSAIDIMTMPYAGYRGDTQTNFDRMFDSINTRITQSGDGSTSSSPQKVLFFVSDGVNDADKTQCSRTWFYAGGVPRCQEPFISTLCDPIKSKGVKIAVLYTTYLPLPTNGWYNSWIKPFQGTIGANMKACASEGLYFEVSPSQGVSEAMNALFRKAVTQVTLTR